MTQPIMYNLIEAKRSTRKLYTEALVGRGDITQEEAENVLAEYKENLERIFAETHAAQTSPNPDHHPGLDHQRPGEAIRPGCRREHRRRRTRFGHLRTGPGQDRCRPPGNPRGLHHAHQAEVAAGTPAKMSREGGIDWGFAEIVPGLAVHGRRASSPGRPGLPPRHVRAAPLGLPRPRERQRVVPSTPLER